MGVRICPNCGGKVSDKLDTCIHCNYKFIDNKKCPDCLESIPIDASSCPVCGHPFTDNLEVKKVSINCPNCGSYEIRDDNDTFLCLSCNSKFLIKDNKPTIINKNYISNISTKGGSSNILLTILDQNKTKNEFLEEVLSFMNESTDTPIDIFDFTISSIEVERYEFVYGIGTAIVNYSRVVGFDREETYTEYETKYDRDLGKDVKVPVTKKRTVTDWRPDNGTVNGEAGSIVLNYEDKTIADLYNIVRDIDLSKDDIINPTDGSTRFIYQSTINEIKDDIISSVFNRNVRFIGDHQKNLNYTGTVNDLNYTIFDIPFYNLTFKHKNNTYNIVSPAYKKISCEFGYNTKFERTDDEKKLMDITHKIYNRIEKTNSLKLFFMVMGIILIIIGAISFIFSVLVGSIVTPIGVVLLIPGAILSNKIIKIRSKTDALERKMLDNMMSQKNDGYRQKLIELNLRVHNDVMICPKSNDEILNELNDIYLYYK